MMYDHVNQNKYFSRKKRPIKKILFVFSCVLFLGAGIFIGFKYIKNYTGIPKLKNVYLSWNKKEYREVYEAAGLILKKRPYDGEVLALKGFAAYYIFAEQTDFSAGHSVLDDAILSLRQALYRVNSNEKAKISYILGKAYYQKGYYYSDLAVKYLDYAFDSGLDYRDLSEFRGMAASVLGKPNKAIEALSFALINRPSDLLLFALAKNYIEIKDTQNAKLYLFETISKTKDVLLEIKCRYLLGEIFLDENEIKKAEKEFNLIIEKDMMSADAHYGLGLIYELQGDLIKARAEWRNTLKLDPLHKKTREKLDNNLLN